MASELFLRALQNDNVEAIRDIAPSVGKELLNTALMRASIIGHEEIARIALENGADINLQDEDGRTMLFMALRHRYRGHAEMFIERGIDVNLPKHNGTNALHYAIKENEMSIVRQILATNTAELDRRNWGGNTPLMIACRYDRREMAYILIDRGARIDICNQLGHYPIHYAAHNNDNMLVMTLVQHGQDPQCRTLLGVTPTMLAAERYSLHCTRYLAPICDVNLHEYLYGGTALHWAIHHGAKDTTNILLRNGGSILETDFSGRSCLMQIVQSKHTDIFERRETMLLILNQLKETDSNTVASHLKYLIHYACFLGKYSAVKTLIEKWEMGKYVLKKDYFGDNALVIALRMGFLDIAEYIMKRLKLQYVPDLPPGDPDIVLPDAPLDSRSTTPSTSGSSEGPSGSARNHTQDADEELVISVRSVMLPLETGAQDRVQSDLPQERPGTEIEVLDNKPSCILRDISAVEHGDQLPSVQEFREPSAHYDSSSSGSSGCSGTSGHTISDPPPNPSGSSSSSGASRKSTTAYGNYQPTSAKQPKTLSSPSSTTGESQSLPATLPAAAALPALSHSGASTSSEDDFYQTRESCLLSPCSEYRTYRTAARHRIQGTSRRVPPGPRIDLRHYLIHRIYSLQNDERTVLMKKYRIFKTYSPVKMSLIEHLKSAVQTQMTVPLRFRFNEWLDEGPEASQLRVTNIELADWLEHMRKNPLSLREACRKFLRKYLGYRASEKVLELPVPPVLKDFLNMKELENLQLHDMNLSRQTPLMYDEDAD